LGDNELCPADVDTLRIVRQREREREISSSRSKKLCGTARSAAMFPFANAGDPLSLGIPVEIAYYKDASKYILYQYM